RRSPRRARRTPTSLRRWPWAAAGAEAPAGRGAAEGSAAPEGATVPRIDPRIGRRRPARPGAGGPGEVAVVPGAAGAAAAVGSDEGTPGAVRACVESGTSRAG